MRIISGKYKGLMLEGFNMEGTRPTMDRVKESLFSMIQDYLVDSTVLDLFSGSGNLAFESLSMGAKCAYLVDYNNVAVKTILKNKDKLHVCDTDIVVIKSDFKKALLSFYNNIKFDVIFLDPPYKTDYIKLSIEMIEKYDLLNDNGVIVCESDDLCKIVYSNKYKNIKEKKYGDKYIVLLKKVL